MIVEGPAIISTVNLVIEDIGMQSVSAVFDQGTLEEVLSLIKSRLSVVPLAVFAETEGKTDYVRARLRQYGFITQSILRKGFLPRREEMHSRA